MKKILMFFLIFAIFCAFNANVTAQVELAPNSKSAILIEATTKRIIYEKNAFEALSPASMTKIMTMILVMEAIDNGKIKMTDMVVTPEAASELGGSQIFLEVNEEMSVHDLLKSVAIASANDAAMSLGIYVGGSEESFVEMMNKKAEELGLKNTHFVNPYGFDDPNHYSCSYDMAIMSAHLVTKYPKILEYTSKYEDYVREDNPKKKFWLVNTNKLVKFMNGVDGLKTGWTDQAKYCLSSTINKNGTRFIAVVMGCDTPDKRTEDTVSLLNFATSNYEVYQFLRKDEIILNYEDVLTKPTKFKIVTAEEVNILKAKGKDLGKIEKKVYLDKSKLNKHDEIVGKLEIYYEGQIYKVVDLKIYEEVKKASLIDVCFEVLKEIFLVS